MARKKRRGILFSLGSKTELVMASYSKEIWGWRHDRGRQPFAEERTNEGGKAKKVETRFVRYFQSGKLESLRIKPSSSSSSVASSPSNHPPYPREQKRKEKKKEDEEHRLGQGRLVHVHTRGQREEKRETGSKPVPVERTYRVERSRAGGGRCIGAPIGIADPCAERGHNVSLEGAPGAPHRNGHNTLPSLAVRVPFPSRNGEKGCRRTTVEGVRHFCVHIYIYIFYRAHIATRCSRPCQAAQRTRTYAPLYARVTRTVCAGERRDAEIHGIEVTHGCGNGGRGAVVGGKKKTRGRKEGRRTGRRE